MNNPARAAAFDALARANVLVERWRDHMDDASQEAALVLWQLREHNAAYSYVSARNAVLAWVFQFLREDYSKRKAAWQDVGHIVHVQLTGREFTTQSPETVLLARERWVERQQAIEAAAGMVLEIMLATRKQKRGRAVKAAVRDTNIILLRLQGYQVEGIAHELDIPPRNIRIYLRLARHRIEKYMKENTETPNWVRR